MPATLSVFPRRDGRTWLDKALSLFTEVRPGEGATALLMLANIFLLLICYSVIKTVREPLVLLGGGAEVRSYAAAGQALLLMGFVPVYSWCASRVDRVKLLVGVTLFFIACIEMFAAAVSAHVRFVGVAFFIWVGIFNISLVAQFWSFANDIYSKEAGPRLFPIIVIGMTAGAPLGSFVAGHLFKAGFSPQAILQISALLLGASVLLYLVVNRRERARSTTHEEPMSIAGGFGLVLKNPYLRLVAALVVLLNVVNTTGEYLVARLLTDHVNQLALANPSFDKQAFIGAFSGDYQFWVNVTALLLQAGVASRLVKHKGLAGALFVLPLIALGGYALIAAGAGFTMMRWIKTAENATDYSIMNTARQLLWLPTTREEKYKAKQAIDTFFVRGGDVLSAGVVYAGTHLLQLSINEFAFANVLMTGVWLFIAYRLTRPALRVPRVVLRHAACLAIAFAAVIVPASAQAQDTREEQLAAARAAKAADLKAYEPQGLERQLQRVESTISPDRTLYPFIGSLYEGGGLAVGPGYRRRVGDTGHFNVWAAYSYRSYKGVNATFEFPSVLNDRLTFTAKGQWLDAPAVSFFGVGNETVKAGRTEYGYRQSSAGIESRLQIADHVAAGVGIDLLDTSSTAIAGAGAAAIDPTYRVSRAFAEYDSRTSPGYTRSGGLYRFDYADYHQMNGDASSFRRMDAEVQQYIPLMRENWVIALRALASTTDAASGAVVPYFLMPELGGHHYLRGYSSFRFRDNDRLLFTGEYRWTAGPFVDMAVFMDAGKVAPRLGDLNVDELKTSRGIGVTFHTPRATVARFEIARSKEGTSLIASFSPSF